MLKEKIRNNYGVIALVSLLIVVSIFATVIQVGRAEQVKSEIAELTDLANALGGDVEAYLATMNYLDSEDISNAPLSMVGGSGDNTLSSFTNLAMKTEGITIDGPVYFTATSSPFTHTYGVIDIALTQPATTTAANPPALGYWCNPGSDLIINQWTRDTKTPNGNWGGMETIGTTTCSGVIDNDGVCGDSLTVTTTATLMTSTFFEGTDEFLLNQWSVMMPVGDEEATSTLGTFYSTDGTGTELHATGTALWLKNGDCIVAHNDRQAATSTHDTDAVYEGSLILDATIR